MTAKTLLIGMSAFKGTLSNREACEAVNEGIRNKIKTTLLPLGDGGRGTFRAIPGDRIFCKASDPMGNAISAEALLLSTSACIESSETCGHHFVQEPLKASSYGLGLQIQGLLKTYPKLKELFVGLGDTATSDAGMGMLQAFGFRFKDKNGHELNGNAEHLGLIEKIIPGQIPQVSFTILCDVANPLCGPMGSARIFSPQKGATPEQVKRIEAGMENFANHVEALTGRNLRTEPSTGAAGGLSFSFLSFFQAQLVPGANYLLDWIHFDDLLSKHDGLITGEGKTDSQTSAGKIPYECIQRAKRLGKKVWLLSGAVEPGLDFLKNASVVEYFECGRIPNPRLALTSKAREIFTLDSSSQAGTRTKA